MPDIHNAPVPYNLRPKATKLAAGPDASLDPPVSPTDALIRGVAVLDWPAADRSKGGTGPPDAPLARPATDPARRSVPASSWPRIFDRNRPVRETLSPLPDLDPDIAMWPVTPLQRWPFAGHPAVGIWPKGWAGIDSNAVMWVCTVGGEPGTWAQVGSGGGGGWPTTDGTGPGTLDAHITDAGDTTGYNFTNDGNGGFNVTDHGTGGINLADAGSGGMFLGVSAGPLNVDVSGAGSSFNLTNIGGGGTDIVDNGGGGIQIHENAVATGGITLDSAHHDVELVSGTGAVDLNAPTGGISVQQVIGTPSDPLTGSDKLYFKSDDNLYRLNSAGSEQLVGAPLPFDANTGSGTIGGGGTVDLVTTATLAVGKWLITATGAASVSSQSFELLVVDGTATATFAGQNGQTVGGGSVVGVLESVTTVIADITVSGTLIIRGSGNSGVAINFAGYTAVKIA